MNRRLLGCGLLAASAIAAALIAMAPRILLFRAQWLLNARYHDYRPFAYRWSGVSWRTVSGKYASAEQLRDVLFAIRALGTRADSQSRLLTARALLLGGNIDQALAQYRLAFNLDSQPAIHAEIGVALAVRAELQHRAVDYSGALEQMMLAWRDGCRTPEAQYNIAALLERFPMPLQAAEKWRELAATERTNEWRQEARERLREVEAHLARREASIARARDIANLAQDDLSKPGTLENAFEEIIENWLPKQWNGRERQTLVWLAGEAVKHHQDRWLNDFIREAPPPPVRSLLSDAHRANVDGDYDTAQSRAEGTEKELDHLSLPATRLAAEAERVYSLQRRGKECIAPAAKLASAAAARSYVLIAIHARLDEITCRARGNLTGTAAIREQVYDSAQHTGYEALTLRALGFLMERHVNVGHPLQTWSRGREGLQRYWLGVTPSLRAHQFYYTLAQAAEAWGRPLAGAVLAAEAERVLRKGRNPATYSLAASKACWLAARVSLECSSWPETEARAEQNTLPAEIRSAIQIEQAETETLRGRPREAMVRLAFDLDASVFGHFLSLFKKRATGNALLALGDLAGAEVYFRGTIEENETRLENVRDKVQRDALYREVEDAFRGLTDIYLKQGKAAQALALWRAFRSQSQVKRGTATKIPGSTLSATFAYLPSGVWAWLEKAGKVEAIRVGDESAVNGLAARFVEMAATPEVNMRDVQSAGESLIRPLVARLTDYLRETGEIVIDAEGGLAQVPWPAVPAGPKSLLIDYATVVQTTGATTGPRKCFTEPRRSGLTLIVAEPKLASALTKDFPPLLDARREAMRLQHRFARTELLDGPAATANAVKSRIVMARNFHFAGHGIANGGFGGLLVAPDPSRATRDVLGAEELANLNLSGLELAFFAACSTADGETGGSLNVDNLVRAVLEAGAGNVVAARWPAQSAVTSDLVGLFYDDWLDGRSAEFALRRAVQHIRTNPRTAHPSFWAGFQIFRRF